MKNLDWCRYTYQHRRAFAYLTEHLIKDPAVREEMRARAEVHDMDKMVCYQYWDQYTSQKYHVEHASHHLESGKKQEYLDVLETVIDYESAPYTKPDKPLNAFDFVNQLFDRKWIHAEKRDELLGVMHELGIDHSGTVLEDRIGVEYLQNLPEITEEMIQYEIMEYIRKHPESLDPIRQEGIRSPQRELSFSQSMEQIVLPRLQALPGRVGVSYYEPDTEAAWEYHGEQSVTAASMIKLFVMLEAYRQLDAGELQGDQTVTLDESMQVPGCGALGYMTPGHEISIRELMTLMIILSDNTATNMLIDLLGMERINDTIRGLGCRVTSLNRRLFDEKLAAAGVQNTICAGEICMVLKKLYHGSLTDGIHISPEEFGKTEKDVFVSRESCLDFLDILKKQQINHKIPFYLQQMDPDLEIAHKTGEDDGITHDGAILFGKEPYVLVICGDETDVPSLERAMQEISLILYQRRMQSIQESSQIEKK